MYMITALRGQATDVLHGILTNATYEESLQALEDRFVDRHFAAAYRSELKMRTQRALESLQDFAMAIEQLAHHAYPTLPEDCIRREALKAFTDMVEDREVEVSLLIEEEKALNEALRQALKLQTVFLAAGPIRLAPTHSGGDNRRPHDRGTQSSQNAGAVESWATLRVPATTERTQKNRCWKPEDRPSRDTRESPRRSEWQPSNNEGTNRRVGNPSGNCNYDQ